MTKTGLTRRLADPTSARRRAEDLLAQIADNKRVITESFYDIGEALREIKTKKLFAALGHASLADLVESRGIMGKTQASKLIGIVETYPREVALKLGPEKAYALSRLAAAGATPVLPKVLLANGVKIHGKVHRVEAVTVRELADQTKAVLRARSNAKKNPERHAAEALAKRGEKRLKEWGGEEVKVRARKRGATWTVAIDMTLASFQSVLDDR